MLLVTLLNGLAFSMLLFILSCGLTLVFGLLGVPNFAHGSLFIFGAYMGYTAARITENWWIGLAAAPLAMAAIGWFLEVMLFRPLYNKDHVFQILMTFAIILIFEDLIKLFWGPIAKIVPIPQYLNKSVQIFGHGFAVTSVFIIIVGVIVCVVIWLVLNRTNLGKAIKASASDKLMASSVGINVNILYTIIFIIASGLAGFGGFLSTLKLSISPGMAIEYLIYGIAVVVIGGAGSYIGSLFGALIIGILYSFGVLIVPRWAMVFVFALLMLTLLIRPRGLFGQLSVPKKPFVPVEEFVDWGELFLFGQFNMKRLFRIGNLFLICILISMPAWCPAFWLVFTTEVLIMALLASSVNLLLGYTGLFSLGQAALFGAGAYTAGLMLLHVSNSLLLSIGAAAGVGVVLAFLIGVFSVRHTELYFAMLTLAFAQFFYTFLYKWRSVTGGDDGIRVPLPSLNFGGLTPDLFTPDSVVKYFYMVLVVVVCCMWILNKIVKSTFGMVLKGIRENAERVDFVGINPRKYRLIAFIIAGFFSAIAGAFFAPMEVVISPLLAGAEKAIDPVFVSVLGGTRIFMGPAVGGLLYMGLKEIITSITEYWMLVFGSILLIIVLAFPNGVLVTIKHRLSSSKMLKRLDNRLDKK